MIFITVGSQKFQFNRLLKEMDRLIETKRVTEPVFAQIGYTDYIPQHYEYKAFLDREEFSRRMNECDIIVTHGGTGTIIKALKLGKKVVGVPRLKKFNEHVDNHQTQLIWQFSNTRMIASCTDISHLGDAIEECRKIVFSPFKSNTAAIVSDIASYLEDVL